MKQYKKISVTHPDMTRFLLPLPEAIDLVLYALVNGESGHIYVRKSPAATLSILAEAMCTLFSYDVGVTTVGIRAGEKMHETLLTQEEFTRAESNGLYYKIPPESQGLDYNKYFFKDKKNVKEKVESYTSENTKRLTLIQTITLLKSLPEIKEALSEFKSSN